MGRYSPQPHLRAPGPSFPMESPGGTPLPMQMSPHLYEAALPPLPPPKPTEQRQAERGRLMDVLVALILIVFGAVRIAILAKDTTTSDAIGVVQGTLWIVLAGFVAAPEISKVLPFNMGVACRSPMFDRGLLYLVAGVANMEISWPVSPNGTRVPSYVLGGILIAIGIVYITLAAKVYGRLFSLTGLDDHQPLLLPDKTPRKGQFNQFVSAQSPYYKAPPLQPPRYHRPANDRRLRKPSRRAPPPPETTFPAETEYNETEIGGRTEYSDSYGEEGFSRRF